MPRVCPHGRNWLASRFDPAPLAVGCLPVPTFPRAHMVEGGSAGQFWKPQVSCPNYRKQSAMSCFWNLRTASDPNGAKRLRTEDLIEVVSAPRGTTPVRPFVLPYSIIDDCVPEGSLSRTHEFDGFVDAFPSSLVLTTATDPPAVRVA